MKWVSFDNNGRAGSGVLIDDRIHPTKDGSTLLQLLQRGNEELAAAGAAAAADFSNTIKWDPSIITAPIVPPSMRDSMGFHEHVRNAMKVVDELHTQIPAFYFSNPQALTGPFGEVRITPGSEMFDYELEVAAVIGKAGSNIRPEHAGEYIAGYTMYIDWSGRDVQMNEMKALLGAVKGKDTATTLGPTFVTADEFEPLRKNKGFDVRMRAWVNDTLISDNNWSTIDWDFDDVVAYTSRGTTLVPGDVIGSGTVGGGCLFEHERMGSELFTDWLRPGDVVEMEVDLIGKTYHTVVESEPVHLLSSGY